MKKTISALLLIIMLSLLTLQSAAITGETSSSTTTIYPGVTSRHVTTGSGTFYGLQDMKIVTFDPKQQGLSVNVTTGYSTLSTLSTVENTLNRWNSAHPEKTPIVAINGDWFTVSYDTNLTVSPRVNIPLGFNMHGGEIVTTQQTSVESLVCGYAPSFGIASDGTPLIGCIDTTTTMTHPYGVVTLDGINRLPANNAIIMYTDKGSAASYCLNDAYELYVDFDVDYTVKHGMNVVGTVTGISRPSEARQAMQQNRMIITARGTRISEISSIRIGDSLRFRVSITDRYGNTNLWRTVSDCVGGHHEFARAGTYFDIGDSTNYPANVIGITADNKVIFLCNDGRQSGYSIGVSINKMDDLARELGIVSGIYMDGGGSTTMLQLNSSGGYDLVNRPCNTNHAQRTVSNAVILAYDNKEPMVTDDLTFDSEDYTQYIGRQNNCVAMLNGDGLNIITTTVYDPFLTMQNFGLSASEYKYIVFDAKTNYTASDSMHVGLYLAAGATTGATENCKANILIPETGQSERVIADLSSLSLWTGNIHSVRVDIFDNFESSPSAAVGRGLIIREMRFFRTLAEAEAYANPPSPVVPGDLNGDGKISVQDLSLMKKAITGSAPEGSYIEANSDIDGDGKITAADLRILKKLIAGGSIE